MSLIDKFINPDLIGQLSLGEKALGSLYVTVLGMAITFVVLGIVWGFMVLLSKACRLREGRVKAGVPGPLRPRPEAKAGDNGELVAVITAAVAACLEVPASAIRVKKIERTADPTPAWGKAGRMEQLRMTKPE